MDSINMINPLPRKVVRNTDNSRYSLDKEEYSEYEAKASRETWPLRYHRIVSQTGYITNNKRLLKSMNIVDWLDLKNKYGPPVLFIDGKFYYLAINMQGYYSDMRKLAELSWLDKKPYYYFQHHEQLSEKVAKLIRLLKHSGYNLNVKPFSNVRNGEAFGFSDALIPKMMVDMIKVVQDEEPEINHIVVFSTNEALLPAIDYIREQEVKVTLGITKNQAVSNFYMSHFDYIVEAIDLLDYSGVIEPFDPNAGSKFTESES